MMRHQLAGICLAFALAFGLALTVVGCGAVRDPGDDRLLVIANQSSRRLTRIELSPVAERAWQPWLAVAVARGELATVAPVPCARYDVLVVADHDARCVLPMVPLCFEDEPWLIDDVTLADCRWAR